MSEPKAPADVEEYLGTTISSPTRGWYEVYENTDPEREGDIHLVPVEYFGTERFLDAAEFAEMMAGGWETVYEGTTRDPTEGSQ